MSLSYDETWELLIRLDPVSLSNACQVNRMYRDICNAEGFWKQKIEYDFGIKNPEKIENLTWKQSWLTLRRGYTIEFSWSVRDIMTYDEVTDLNEDEMQAVNNAIEKHTKMYIRKREKDLLKYFEYRLTDGDDRLLLITLYPKRFEKYNEMTQEELSDYSIAEEDDLLQYAESFNLAHYNINNNNNLIIEISY